MRLPTTLAGFLYDSVAAPFSAYKSSIGALWPILRAYVWYSLWLERKNRAFRSTLTHLSAASLAVKAATITRLHLRHLVRRDEEPQLVLSLSALREDPWCARYLVPRRNPQYYC
ncbi:hypothetical protein ACHHYP_20575 [Achlya hypogyna]|uniref:Uncharacterized protein n=1 Tax=Achlya hypogyna TaxID=1202772 RepID=A0A1V9YI84_ACHHY|nr:hypothetical protein ACHHYP_20575 [Achlya hypogyna]